MERVEFLSVVETTDSSDGSVPSVVGQIVQHWRCRQLATSKSRYISAGPNCITCHKTEIYIGQTDKQVQKRFKEVGV